MRFLLDANIIIRALTADNQALRSRLAACDEGDLATSAIAYAEVALGSRAGKAPPAHRLQAFIEEVTVLDFDRDAAQAYATLRFKRASFDRLIAAHALSRGLTLVTDNVADFADVPGIRIENWTLPR